MTIILPASLCTAAACALINLWLAIRVGQMRRLHNVSVGDGGNMAVIARMRAHANFTEYAPVVLILLALLELARGTSWIVWGYGFAFVVARLCHGVGMDTWKPGRGIGVVVTMLVMVALAGHCAWVALSTPNITAPMAVTLPATA
ncbi:MAPEG family protein [Sphingomonas donggukensis]|uniref:MAPEG family protein n=1 Tax=Sphingomonas donggukensis TaxID=2949093 RepID=A0ABY4TVQ1_9SPHN|nr:MAPEG family protein [Sphingomonas donggukensis]URW75244.1 MAPEG family protein [Sphingomonas donggukensis]